MLRGWQLDLVRRKWNCHRKSFELRTSLWGKIWSVLRRKTTELRIDLEISHLRTRDQLQYAGPRLMAQEATTWADRNQEIQDLLSWARARCAGTRATWEGRELSQKVSQHARHNATAAEADRAVKVAAKGATRNTVVKRSWQSAPKPTIRIDPARHEHREPSKTGKMW